MIQTFVSSLFNNRRNSVKCRHLKMFIDQLESQNTSIKTTLKCFLSEHLHMVVQRYRENFKP